MLSLFFFIQANGIIETSKTISPFKKYLQQLMGTTLLSKNIDPTKKQLYPQTPFDSLECFEYKTSNKVKYKTSILTTELLNAWESLFQTFSTNNSLNSEIFSNQETLDGEISPIDLMAAEILNELKKNKDEILRSINDKTSGGIARLILINPFFSKIDTAKLGFLEKIALTAGQDPISKRIITSIITNINTFMKKDVFSKYFPFNNNLQNKTIRNDLTQENYKILKDSDLNIIFVETLRYFTCWYLKINNIDESQQIENEEKLLREKLEKILIKNIALSYCLFAQEL